MNVSSGRSLFHRITINVKRMNRLKVICVVDMRLVCKTIAPQKSLSLDVCSINIRPPKPQTPNLKPVKMSEE